MYIKLNYLKQVLDYKNRQNIVGIPNIIRRTIYLLGLSAIFINPVAASEVQIPQISSTMAENYIAQTTAEDFLRRGVQKLEIGDLRGAIEDFNQAIEINPNYASAYYHRGIARVQLGNEEEAIADLQKAADLSRQQGDMTLYQFSLDQIQMLQQ